MIETSATLSNTAESLNIHPIVSTIVSFTTQHIDVLIQSSDIETLTTQQPVSSLYKHPITSTVYLDPTIDTQAPLFHSCTRLHHLSQLSFTTQYL